MRIPVPPTSPLTATALLVGGLTLARLAALFLSPLELYPDEAQYWLWSRELAFGYYSKPPVVAWLIALTTAIGGDGEPWVRVSALWLHAGAALALFAVGRRLYDGWTGFWSAALYSLMPGVQLSSAVIATDAPLLLFLALALCAYVGLLQTVTRRSALALGAALGAAALSKYAALYFVAGLILHAAASTEARRRWSVPRLAMAVLAFAVVLGPNLVWNAANGFETVSHTAANTDWENGLRFDIAELVSFIGAQFGVFGPLPFAVLGVAAIVLAVRNRLRPEDRLLLCFALPPLVIVAAQAFAARANANWAVAAYVPGAVLVAAWLVRWRARRTLSLTVFIQGLAAAVFLVGIAHPPIADALGLGNGLKRARGWRASTDAVLARVEPGLTAIAVDDRFLYNAIAYYGRERLAAPDAPPLTVWVREATPQNQAEATAPLTGGQGRRVLAASLVEDFRGEMKADFRRTRDAADVTVPLDPKRSRAVQIFVAEAFSPKPRDPETGLPISARPTRP